MDATFWMIAFMTFGYFLVRAINLKINYFKSYGICLDYDTAHHAFFSYPKYEYEIDEDGEIVRYVNRGISVLYFGEGKKQKILINKKNHNKVVGYRKFVFNIFLLLLQLVVIAVMLMLLL